MEFDEWALEPHKLHTAQACPLSNLSSPALLCIGKAFLLCAFHQEREVYSYIIAYADRGARSGKEWVSFALRTSSQTRSCSLGSGKGSSQILCQILATSPVSHFQGIQKTSWHHWFCSFAPVMLLPSGRPKREQKPVSSLQHVSKNKGWFLQFEGGEDR